MSESARPDLFKTLELVFREDGREIERGYELNPAQALWKAAKRRDQQGVEEAIARGADPLLAALEYGFDPVEQHDFLRALLPLCVSAATAVPPSAAVAAALLRDEQAAIGVAPLCDPLARPGGWSESAWTIWAKAGSVAALEALFEALPSESREAAAREALAWSAAFGNASACAWLAARCDAQAPDAEGRTPLMLAAESGAIEAVEALLPWSDPRARSRDGGDALMAAVEGESAVCAARLAPISEPNARNHLGMSALMIAAARGLPECVAALIPFCDAQQIGPRRRSPLMMAACCGAGQVVSAGSTEARRPLHARCVELLEPLSETDREDEDGRCALRLAIEADNDLAVTALITPEAARRRFSCGRTPLIIAAQTQSPRVVSALLELSELGDRARADASSHLLAVGDTAPALAARLGRHEALAAMLPKLDLFERLGEQSLLELALRASACPAAASFLNQALPWARQAALPEDASAEFRQALAKGLDDWSELLLPRSRPESSCPFSGQTALMAAAAGSPAWVERLLPRSNPLARDHRGMSALAFAAAEGRHSALLSLLPLSDPRAADSRGMTPLMLAAEAGSVESVVALLPLSDPLALNQDGQSAFLMGLGQPEIIEALGPFAGAAAVDLRGRDAFDCLFDGLSRSEAPMFGAERWRWITRLVVALARHLPEPHPLIDPKLLAARLKGLVTDPSIGSEEFKTLALAAAEAQQLSRHASPAARATLASWL